MDIYLTELETGDRIRFPMLPEKIRMQSGALTNSYTTLDEGDVKIPSGKELDGFSWDAMFPGEARRNQPYVRAWRSPRSLQAQIERFKGKKLRLMVTGTPINHDVYIRRFSPDFSGGQGDCNYNINLEQQKDLIVTVSAPAAPTSPKLAKERPPAPAAKTYTVKPGDCLWKIAQQLMGGGANYPKLYEANKSVIGGNPNLIFPGQVLTIPA